MPVFCPKRPSSHSWSAISARCALRLAHAPADVEAGEIAHRERPHREAERRQRAVDLLRQRAFEQQPLGLDRRARAACGCRQSRGRRRPPPAPCRSCAPTDIAVASTSGAVSAPRTISSSRITFAGLKKCMPSTVCGPRGDCGDLVDVEIGGVGRENRAGLVIWSSLPNTSLLTPISSNTASITMSASASAAVGRAGDQTEPLSTSSSRQAAALGGGLIILADRVEPALQRLLRWSRSMVTGMPALAKHMAMPPPMVPAPITAGALDFARLHVLRQIRRPWPLRVRRKRYAAAPSIVRRFSAARKVSRSRISASATGTSSVHAQCLDCFRRRMLSARRASGMARPSRRISPGWRAARELVLAVARARKRLLFRNNVLRKRHGGGK